MSKSRSTSATMTMLSLGFAAMGSASAFAAPHAYQDHSKARHVAGHRLAHPGHAGPVSSAPWTFGSGMYFVPGRGIVGESCDLPTSACPNRKGDSN